MPFSKGSSRPRDQTQVSYNAGRFLVGELRSHMLQSLYIYIYIYIYMHWEDLEGAGGEGGGRGDRDGEHM